VDFVFAPAPQPSVAIAGSRDRFPVHRIYCIGRNYADHAKEMGMPVDRGNPIFFCKPNDAVVEDGAIIPYPSGTQNLHHEVEMVVALKSGGTDVAETDALTHVFGYGVGIDFTRRDLQMAAKAKGNPWDTGKAFDHSAPVSSLHPVDQIGHPGAARIALSVDGETRQTSNIAEMLFSVPQIIHELSKLFALKAGDLIYTGTPAGVAAVKSGDTWHATLEGIAELRGSIA
jgi:fumarylpyruvate hydrolase